jgi:hypothetical protein
MFAQLRISDQDDADGVTSPTLVWYTEEDHDHCTEVAEDLAAPPHVRNAFSVDCNGGGPPSVAVPWPRQLRA